MSFVKSPFMAAWTRGFLAWGDEIITTEEWDRIRAHVEMLRRSGAYED